VGFLKNVFHLCHSRLNLAPKKVKINVDFIREPYDNARTSE
jgi:hypothetical protein